MSFVNQRFMMAAMATPASAKPMLKVDEGN
jgi:hypothetical protein